MEKITGQLDIDQVKEEKLIRNSELSERFRKEVVAPFEDVRQRVKEGDDSQPPMPLVEVKQYILKESTSPETKKHGTR